MKICNRMCKSVCAFMLVITMLVGLFPAQAMAASPVGIEYSVANDYIKYSINTKTGGFCIETKEGHPQKSFDNNIPLLYKEDRNRSNGTSFVTVRIDDKDYIFGQEYGWFGIETKTSMPVISEEGRQISVTWSIKGYDITQKVVVSLDENNNLAGNVGIAYTVKNNNETAGNVGIRLMLDNALDNNMDAPYVVADGNLSPTIVETEFSKEKNNMPQQLRFVDSISKPEKMGYAILEGWSGENDILPDKVIVGHWANIANTRYEYNVDIGCDFSNYSNIHRIADTATAFYWSEKKIEAGAERKAEMLYGVGNFSKELTKEKLGINMTIGRVDLDESGNAYADGGKFPVKVTLDNSVDGARDLVEPMVKLTVEDGLVFEQTGTKEFNVAYEGGILVGGVKEIDVVVVADKQAQITSKRIVVSVNATEIVDAATHQLVEYSTNRNVLLPAVGGVLPNIQMTQISPDTVYYDGEKNVSISGEMGPFSALSGSDGWSLYLVSTATGKETLIQKSKIAFTDDSFETMSFSTDEELTVGRYKIVFKFTDKDLMVSFGSQVTAAIELNVSSDPKDRCVSYGIVSMVRFRNSSNKVLYDLVSFANEEEMEKFENGNMEKNGLVHKKIKMTDDDEFLMVVRGKIRQMMGDDGKPFYQASTSDGDITINNILTYCGTMPLNLTSNDEGVSVAGDGTIKVINSINIWHNMWSFNVENGTKYTLDQDAVGEGDGNELELSLDGAGSMLQFIAGFLIDIKYGVLTEDEGRYNINFGGKITLPISRGGGADKGSGEKGEEDEDEGAISAEITSILYGEKKDSSTGFVGIDTTLKVGLPENVLGSLVKNAFGFEAEVTINTIKNYYRIQLGVDLTIVECEGVIALKQVPINSIPRIVPDEISFKIAGDIMEIPIVPPFVSLTGIGGGIKNLADTLSDDTIGQLPPLTLMLSTSLCLIETLDGDFALELSLYGFSLDGSMTLRGDEEGLIMRLEAGLAARWIDPFFINAYGSISVYDGLLKGGFTIKISDNYFYGYIFASLSIPESIPLVGGMELAGVEAAISSDFIGANVRIIGISFGFIYYWEGDYEFGSGIDLSSRGEAVTILPESYYDEQGKLVDYTGMYGTNMRRLNSVKVPSARSDGASVIKEFDPSGEDALMLEVPFTGAATPKADEIKLVDPDGTQIVMIPDDGNGNGNFLIQERGADGRYLYISITNPEQLKAGNWKLSVLTDGVTIKDFAANGVDNLPEISGISFVHGDPKSKELNVSWTTDSKGSAMSTLDIYVTEYKDIFSKLEVSETTADNDMQALTRIDLEQTESGNCVVTIPDSFAEGNYYVVGMLSQKEGGMSKVISSESFEFANDALPKEPEAVELSYAGNGGLKIDVTDPVDATYDTYLVTIYDKYGVEVPDAYGEYPIGKPIYFNKNGTNTNTPILKADEAYSVSIATKCTIDGSYYYSSYAIDSELYTMPKINTPKLLKVESNITPETEITKKTEFTATYTFDQPVKFVASVDDKNVAVEVATSKTTSEDGLSDTWILESPLEDGIHVIDFTAYNAASDSVTGANCKDVAGSQFGFTVDSQPPVLSLGKTAASSLDRDAPIATVSNQTVFMDGNGIIILKGVTEAGSILTLGNSADGVKIESDGSFTIERKVDNKKAYDQQLLKAIDKVGNETVLTISIVNSWLAAFETLSLLADADVEIDKDTGLKYVELSIGETVSLSVNGQKEQKTIDINSNDVSWNVLYEQNIISFDNGRITALSPGETAIRVSYKMASYNADVMGKTEGQVDANISDVIVVKVTDPGYRYKLLHTNKYTILTVLADAKTFGAITATVGDKTTMLLYDEKAKAYVGVFDGVVSSDTLLKNLTIHGTSEKPVILVAGDTNGDGIVTSTDINCAVDIFLQGCVGKNGDLNELVRADLNGDGKVDIVDAQLAYLKLLKNGR